MRQLISALEQFKKSFHSFFSTHFFFPFPQISFFQEVGNFFNNQLVAENKVFAPDKQVIGCQVKK